MRAEWRWNLWTQGWNVRGEQLRLFGLRAFLINTAFALVFCVSNTLHADPSAAGVDHGDDWEKLVQNYSPLELKTLECLSFGYHLRNLRTSLTDKTGLQVRQAFVGVAPGMVLTTMQNYFAQFSQLSNDLGNFLEEVENDKSLLLLGEECHGEIKEFRRIGSDILTALVVELDGHYKSSTNHLKNFGKRTMRSRDYQLSLLGELVKLQSYSKEFIKLATKLLEGWESKKSKKIRE